MTTLAGHEGENPKRKGKTDQLKKVIISHDRLTSFGISEVRPQMKRDVFLKKMCSFKCRTVCVGNAKLSTPWSAFQFLAVKGKPNLAAGLF